MNRAKDKLRGGGTVVVFNPNFPSPALVEHAGALGFDVAFIDCERGSAGFERAEELARAARAAGMTSILRPWSAERALVTRYLDGGVGGIQFPGIDDASAAQAAVATVREARGAQFADWEEGRELMSKGVRWITIHAKTMLARGTRDLISILGSTDGHIKAGSGRRTA
jgi:2-keto-3-deoxy-L-rhamnonate aldolase RhmA